MLPANRLGRDFYNRATPQVGREILGMRLVRVEGTQRISGLIVEAEAYVGEADQACHARVGKTRRTQVMYGPPGHAYVYFTYGMHWMLNFVTEAEGFPAAVLIRAIWPQEGSDIIATRRSPQPAERWTDGPAKLCQALGIDGRLNGTDLCAVETPIFVERGEPFPDFAVTIGPRVGLNNTPEPWKSTPWRFRVNR